MDDMSRNVGECLLSGNIHDLPLHWVLAPHEQPVILLLRNAEVKVPALDLMMAQLLGGGAVVRIHLRMGLRHERPEHLLLPLGVELPGHPPLHRLLLLQVRGQVAGQAVVLRDLIQQPLEPLVAMLGSLGIPLPGLLLAVSPESFVLLPPGVEIGILFLLLVPCGAQKAVALARQA